MVKVVVQTRLKSISWDKKMSLLLRMDRNGMDVGGDSRDGCRLCICMENRLVAADLPVDMRGLYRGLGGGGFGTPVVS